ncbi:MAG: cytochrome P450 [Inhella sp.]
MQNRSWNDLPGPTPRWWGWPDFRAMQRDLLGFVNRQRTLGDWVRHQVLNERSLDLFDPEALRRLLIDRHDQLIRYERGPEVFAQTMGQSVLVTEGARWQRQRRMLQQGFGPRQVAGFARLMSEAGAAAFDALPGGDTDMDALFTHLTMDVILRTLFSHAGDAQEAQSAAQAMKDLGEIGLREMFWPFSLPDWLPLPALRRKRRALRVMRELLQRHLSTRAADPHPPQDDVLAMLQALRDPETGQALAAQEIFDQCMVTFQAGHETSASALLWWSALMAAHPEAQTRAAAEVAQALQGRAPGPQDLAALPWLCATLKEALRLYPPIPALLTRRTLAEIELAGVRLPRRLLVRITPWVLQRDPRHFPESEAFRPERFLPDAPTPPRGAYIPFGIGPRVCLGQHFALLELNLLAAQLLQRFRLLPLAPGLPTPAFHVTLRPQDGLRLKLQRV